jgi:hypothetical protein
MSGIAGFNSKRFFLLIRNSLFLNRSSILIASAVVLVIIILQSILDSIATCSEDFYYDYYFLILFISGLAVTSKISKGLNHEAKGPAWILLPASTLEKLISLIVLSTVITAVSTLLFLSLASLVSEAINWIFIGSCHTLFNAFDTSHIHATMIYLIIQTPFLLGAIYFKKHALSKTFLSLFVYSMFLVSITLLTGRIVFGHFPWDSLYMQSLLEEIATIDPVLKVMRIGERSQFYAKIFFGYIMVPLCWVIAYFRLKETEK